MDIDEYDENGRTSLMNAAFNGDYDEVKRLLDLGADPSIADDNFGTTTAEDIALRLAKKSETHRKIYNLLVESNPKAKGTNISSREILIEPEVENSTLSPSHANVSGRESDSHPFWHVAVFIGLIVIFFPWSLLLILLLFGWDGSISLFRELFLSAVGIAVSLIILAVVLAGIIAVFGG